MKLSGGALVIVLTSVAAPALADEPDYWAAQRTRAFVGGDIAVGVYNRAQLVAGWGKPRWTWVGAVAGVSSTTDFGAPYAGLEADALLINASVTARATYAYSHRSMKPAPRYDDAALDASTGAPSRYASVDLSVWGYVPAGPTLGYWEWTTIVLPAKSDDVALFEEYARYVTDRRAVGFGRLLWSVALFGKRLYVGPAVDIVVSVNRDPVVRAGGSLTWVIGPHLRLGMSLTVPVASPDTIGWFTQSWGIGRLTWAWSTGEPKPGLL